VVSFKNKGTTITQLPTCISFLKPYPPDSIQTFIKPYLQFKKIKILEWTEVNRLVGEEINGEVMTLINSGQLNKKTIEKLSNRFDPVSNVLSIQIFQNPTDSTSYIIDSIRWQIRYIPAKDTIAAYNTIYVSENGKEKNPYVELKAFLDKVISSGYLK
jgi:hypothetical protein